MAETKWFEQSETKATWYTLKPPYDRIVVGCDPRDGMTKETADSFDAFVNVSDTACSTFEPSRSNQAMHWYPVNECGLWNLSYLFWLKTVLDHHFDAGHRIYLHCHAGAYRSPSAAVLWLQSRGHPPEEALELGKENGSSLYRLWKSYDNIPKLKDKVFDLMRKHPDYALASILHLTEDHWNKEILSGHCRKLSLLHHYFWFYYQPKWWIKNKIYNIKSWLKGLGYHTVGIGTWYYKRKNFFDMPKNAEPLDLHEKVSIDYKWNYETRSWKEQDGNDK